MENNVHEFTLAICSNVMGAFKNIGYELGKQKSFNRKVVLFAVVTSCYIFVSEKRSRDHEAKIHKLEREIAEFKNQKG